MNKYDYLTEHEKRLIQYIEYVPCELSDDDIYTDNDISELEFLNDAFNVKF